MAVPMIEGHKVNEKHRILHSFSHISQLIIMEFDMVLEQNKLKSRIPLSTEIFSSQRELLLFYRLYQKSLTLANILTLTYQFHSNLV